MSTDFSDRTLTGLEGFVTLVNDPTQIRAFYGASVALEPGEIALARQASHRLQEGRQIGWKAENLLAQKWELDWERPLADWRLALGIVPAT